MLSRMLKYLVIACMVTTCLPAWAKLSDAEAVNMSGLQRMLSQRIAKSYLMLGQRVSVREATQQREKSVVLFEKNLSELKTYAPTPEISTSLGNVEAVWSGYKKRVLTTPSKSEALSVIRQSDEVLTLSEKVVKQIQDYSKVSSARLVNISGRQRMLSQRIGKLYLTQSWGLNYDGLDHDLQVAISEYESTLQELTDSGMNTPDIKEGLARVKSIWKFSKAGFALSNDNLFVPTAICNTTENLLKHMQTITKLYEQQMQLADNNKNLPLHKS
ncbi:MAG: type IV pili methyl-accepting chemotaxis transducer N-terminal domain-containing protein [Agitococcus sp.]|nr:type IV pili methyl-accepting chemotaxis transducer N-terminal domain-containing protein [Agitococcus sp.]